MSQQNLPIGEHDERKVKREVEVKLSVAEEAQLHKESQDILSNMKKLDIDFDIKKKEFNAAYDQLEAALHQVIEKSTKTEVIDCIEKRFFEQNLVQVWNGDEMIEERAMTPQERQGDLLQNGVVVEPDSDEPVEAKELTPEEAEEDLRDVIAEEKNPMKPSVLQ